jgi:DNA-binding Lrp family transcriptional regulator
METELLDILIEIQKGNDTASDISKKLGIARTTVNNRIKKLSRQNLIRKGVKIHNKRQLLLTKTGEIAVTKFFRGFKEQPRKSHLYRFHNYRYLMKITKAPVDLIARLKQDNFIVSSRRTWNAYVKHGEEDYTIEFTPKSVILHVRQLHIDDIHTGELILRRFLKDTKKDLEKRFLGLVLGSPTLVAKLKAQHLAEDSESNVLAAYNQMFTEQSGQRIQFQGESLIIDNSKGPTEVETFRKQHAGDDMIHLNEQLDFITSKRFDVEALDKAYKALQDVPTKITDIEKATLSLSKAQISMNDGIVAMNQAMGNIASAVEKQGLSVVEMAKNNEDFAIAMREHLTLVNALQQVAYKTRDGMQTMAVEFASALKGIAQAQDRQAEALLQLSKPWYIKLKESIMEGIAKWRKK